MSMARNMYGMHAPIKMAMERSLVTKARGVSMLPQKSRTLGEEILLGKDESIDFEDFLNSKEGCRIVVSTSVKERLIELLFFSFLLNNFL